MGKRAGQGLGPSPRARRSMKDETAQVGGRGSSVHLEQIVQVVARERLGAARIFAEYGGDEVLLLLLQLQDLFFDRARGDQAIHGDDLLLTDAVCAIGRLNFDRGVPPRVEVITVSAAVRLRPEPPALRLIRNTGTVGSLWKRSM